MGYDVTIIMFLWKLNSDGSKSKDNNIEYVNNRVKVLRITTKYRIIYRKLKVYFNIMEKIDSEKPDILFINVPKFSDLVKVIRHLRKRKIKVYVDNHADFLIVGKN